MTVRGWSADRLLTGVRGVCLEPGAVLVDGGTILWAGPPEQLPVPVALTELGDVTLLPGLIDAHVHLTFDATADPVAALLDPEQSGIGLAGQVHQVLDAFLDCGVTTVRDLGSPAELLPAREQWVAERRGAPRTLLSGPPLTSPGGHCWFLGGGTSSPATSSRLVEARAEAGAEWIKVMVSGGFLTPGSPPPHATQIDAEHLRAITRTAHALGLRVGAHAHGARAVEAALEAGVDTVEHASFVGEDGVPSPDRELVARLAASATPVCPTVNLRMPELAGLIGRHRLPPVEDLLEAGVRVVAGTDAGIGQLPHHGYLGGLQALSWFGMSTEDVLVAATSGAADALGLSGVTGRLAPGRAADLIGVGGDPRTDLGVLADLRLVVAGGVEHAPRPLPPIQPYRMPESSSGRHR